MIIRYLQFSVIYILLLCIDAFCLKGSEPKYKVSEIPKNLLKDSKAVVRKNEVQFRISDYNKAILNVTQAITILNENGIEKSLCFQSYDKFSSVRKFSVTLYDQNGETIRNGANVKTEDYSAIPDYSLYSDTRVKFVDPKYRTLPFTVELSYEVTFNGLFSYPAWQVYEDYNIGIENSSFIVTCPQGFKFRFKEVGLKDSCHITNSSGKVEYKWEVKNKPPIRRESFSLPLSDISPTVYLAPDDFELGGTKGNCETWNSLGKWLFNLGEDRNILEPETKEKILSLVASAKSDEEKIRILYKYFQEKVRYVNVKMGLGGWQTIDAATVDRLSYGDCKALSNYMKSLLDVIGIKSRYTVVKAGDDAPAILDDFPSNQFNHAILCIPRDEDTIWLECTSLRIPFGYLGMFTDDRKALIVDESGSTLVRTKQYGLNDNLQIRNGSVRISANGNAESEIHTTYKGTLYDKLSPLLGMDESDRKIFIQKHIPVPSFNLSNYSFNEIHSMVPSITENLRITIANCGSLTGNRIFFTPNIYSQLVSVPNKSQERKSLINIPRSFQEHDTIDFVLPQNFFVEKLPGKKHITGKFGEYNSETVVSGSGIKYMRSLSLIKGEYPVSDYNSFVDFCEQIATADQSKVILSNAH